MHIYIYIYIYIIRKHILRTIKWFQVLLYNSQNLTSLICLNTVCSILPIDGILSSATTPEKSGPESNGNEGVLSILRISKAGTSPSDGSLLYLSPSAVTQSVSSTAPADWVGKSVMGILLFLFINIY